MGRDGLFGAALSLESIVVKEPYIGYYEAG
jgi:hypothetical protein